MTPKESAQADTSGPRTFFKTTYRNHGLSSLLNYMAHDGTIRDAAGTEMTDEQREKFVEKSKRHGFERDFIVSPDPEDGVSKKELGKGVRKAMTAFAKKRPTVAFCYVVHSDKDHPDAHVAMTGDKSDLKLDVPDLKRERQRFHDMIRGVTSYQRRQEKEQRQQQEREQEQEQARDAAHDSGVGR